MGGPWMLCSQNGLDHGHHHDWARDALSQNGFDHGRHHAWAMDALFSERGTQSKLGKTEKSNMQASETANTRQNRLAMPAKNPCNNQNAQNSQALDTKRTKKSACKISLNTRTTMQQKHKLSKLWIWALQSKTEGGKAKKQQEKVVGQPPGMNNTCR